MTEQPEERKQIDEVEARFATFHFSAANAVQLLNKIPVQLSIKEIDEIVLTERSELSGKSLEEISQRVIELNNAFLTLQRQAKILKQKHIVALEEYRNESDKLTPEEIKQVRKSKKNDDVLTELEKSVNDILAKRKDGQK